MVNQDTTNAIPWKPCALCAQTVVSNATRWDTFEYMLDQNAMPRSEQLFRKRYKKSPSFISIHMGVKADALPKVGLPFWAACYVMPLLLP